MESVTTVLDYFTEPELLRWQLNKGKAAAERESTEAKRIGSKVDELVRMDLLEGSYAVLSSDEPTLTCMKAWERFKEQQPTFAASIKHCQRELTDGELVGHPDFECQDARGWGIVDLKTSGAIYPKHWTQVAEYALLKQQMEQLPPAAFIGILRLDKRTGLPEYQELTDPAAIAYEQTVFAAYHTTYLHGMRVRERLRWALEQELLCTTK